MSDPNSNDAARASDAGPAANDSVDTGPADRHEDAPALHGQLPAGESRPDSATDTSPAAHAPSPWYRRKTTVLVAGGTAVALLLGGGGVAAGAMIATSVLQSNRGDSGSHSRYDHVDDDRPHRGDSGDSDRGDTDTSAYETTSTATDSTWAEEVGVATILTTIGYSDSAAAAGTGMVMTADGLLLTNNHVIDGSTSIEVTVESTGRTYSATVVGSDATTDIAVLQLENASGLATVKFDSDDTTAVGDSVYSVGNAEGTGNLVTATGEVTALDQSITVSTETTGAQEALESLIEVDSDVVSGDSGGPLFDAEGDVIGIITAASSGSASIIGYAVDIDAALAVAQQIESGTETATVQIGATPFLGVALSNSSNGANANGVSISGVVDGTPAASAGLTAGDLITAVDGVAVASPSALSSEIAGYDVGDTVAITWTNATGTSATASIVLAAGPA